MKFLVGFFLGVKLATKLGDWLVERRRQHIFRFYLECAVERLNAENPGLQVSLLTDDEAAELQRVWPRP